MVDNPPLQLLIPIINKLVTKTTTKPSSYVLLVQSTFHTLPKQLWLVPCTTVVNGQSIKQRTSRVQVLVILALCVFTFGVYGVYGVSREGWHLCQGGGVRSAPSGSSKSTFGTHLALKSHPWLRVNNFEKQIKQGEDGRQVSTLCELGVKACLPQ